MKKVKGGDKMDSKTLWAVIVTALIVALLTSLITVKLTGNVVQVSTGTSASGGGGGVSVSSKLVADSAEIGGITIDKDGIYNNKTYLDIIIGRVLNSNPRKNNNVYIPGQLQLGGDMNGGIIKSLERTPFSIYTHGGVFIYNSSDVRHGASLTVAGRANITQTLNVGDLKGTGNAYVCVDSTGKLYRSSSACSTAPITYTLSVAKTGTGKGDVIGTDIYCGSLCSAKYDPGKIVSLVAYPAVGSRFVGWSGACAGTSQVCTVTMDNNKFVTAQFSV